MLRRIPISFFSTTNVNSTGLAKSLIDELVKKNPLVVFMKGTPARPLCGFSRTVVDVLKREGVSESSIKSFNVLEDEAVRQEIKRYTSWPTIPQVFIQGEFIGGCDSVLDMHRSGELAKRIATLSSK